MKSFYTERIFCCSSLILIKNRCFIFLCVSINKCHNPLSLKVLLKYMKRCKRTNNHLQTISAHVLFSHFHSFSRRDRLDTKAFAIRFCQNWGQSKRIIFDGAHFEQDFLIVFSLQELTSSLSFNSRQYLGGNLSERASMTSGSIAKVRRSGRDFTDSVEWNLNSTFSDLLNFCGSCF